MRFPFLLALVALLTPAVIAAQPRDRVRWHVRPIKTPVRVGDTLTLQVSATIDADWHIYALTQRPEGPYPLRITADAAPSATIAARGDARGPTPERFPTSPFGIPVEWYTGTARFDVPVRIVSPRGDAVLKIRYQACSETLCLPPRTIALATRLTTARD